MAGRTGFQFGISYKKEDNPPGSRPGVGKPAPGKLNSTFKYTPTVSRTGQKSNQFPGRTIGGGSSNASRFSGAPKNEPAKPSFGNAAASDGQSAGDRMAYFRESMEKERKAAEAKKAKEEEKKKLDEERKKKEEEEKKRQEAEEKEKEEEGGDENQKKKSAPACKKREKKPARRTMSISNIVLDWVQEMTKDYPIEIRNFSTSWSDGMAFCALIHHFNPDEFDFSELKPENRRYNFDLAFNTGSKAKDIPILLDTNDMVRMKKPEPRSVQTYIQWIWSVYGPTSGYGPTPQEVQEATLG